MSTIACQKTTGTLGAEVFGLDLSQNLEESVVNELNSLWLENGVLFFRDQQISLPEHIAFAAKFGEPHVHTQCTLAS